MAWRFAVTGCAQWIRHTFNLKKHRGKIGRIVLVDAMSGSSCSWFAVDDFMWLPDAESPTHSGALHREGPLFNFSDCSSDGWNVTGNFEVVKAGTSWVYKSTTYLDQDYADYSDTFIVDSSDCEFNSYVGGETKTGTALSNPFYITADTLSFWSVGFSSGSCSNRLGKVTTSYVAVVNATDNTDVWATTSALGGTGSTYSDGDYVRCLCRITYMYLQKTTTRLWSVVMWPPVDANTPARHFNRQLHTSLTHSLTHSLTDRPIDIRFVDCMFAPVDTKRKCTTRLPCASLMTCGRMSYTLSAAREWPCRHHGAYR